MRQDDQLRKPRRGENGGEFPIESTPKVGTTVVLSFPPDRGVEGVLKMPGEKA